MTSWPRRGRTWTWTWVTSWPRQRRDVEAVLDRYTSKESSLNYQASATESQGMILDQAVENRRGSSLSVEQILLNLILGDTGGIVDSSG